MVFRVEKLTITTGKVPQQTSEGRLGIPWQAISVTDYPVLQNKQVRKEHCSTYCLFLKMF